MPKIIKIKRGRQNKLADQPGEERQGNPKKIAKVSSRADRSYKRTPVAPRMMAAVGREYWRDLAPGYVASNRLNKSTKPLFEQLCNALATWTEWKDKDLERRAEGLSILQEPKVAKNCLVWEVHFSKLHKSWLEQSAQYEKKEETFNTFQD